MRRIAIGSNRNPAIDLFGTGKHGFKTGNRSLGDPPSTPGGEWFNSIQEELARVVEATGVSLDPANFDQLLTSIKFIAWGAGKTAAPWAPLSSPVLTDTPTAPTASDGTNTKQIATTAFVQSAVGGYLSKAVTGAADVTLTDLEASNPVIAFTGTLTASQVVILPATTKRLWAIYNATSGAYALTVKTASGSGVTVAQGKRNLVYTDGANVYDGFNDFENIALTGTSTATTAAVGTNTTQIATTSFVNAEIAADRPFESTLANIKMDGAQSVGSLNTVARGDHVHPTDTSRAPLASPALTGTPTAPTPAVGTSSTQIANMAAVQAELSAQKYVSPDLTMSNGGQIVVNHGLGAEPMHISLHMRCVAADMGYAVGDVIRIAGGTDPNGVNESLGVLVNNTQIIVRVGDAGPQLIAHKANGTGAAATTACWRLIIKASK